MQSLHRQRIILLALSSLGVIAAFLPWIKANGSSTIGISTPGYHSWVALLCLLGTIVLCTYGDRTKELDTWMKYIAVGLCGIAAIMGILKVLSTIGWGLILLQICSIGSVFIALNISPKKNDGIKELKE
jgi:CDP-diglyceride synthetase